MITVLLMATVAVGGVDSFAPFSQGEQLSSRKINANFQGLQDRIVKLDSAISPLDSAISLIKIRLGKMESMTHDGQYSIGAVFCGQTDEVVGDILGAYAGAKKRCEKAKGCGGPAHMCTVEELTRSMALEFSPPSGPKGGWYSGGIESYPGGVKVYTDKAINTDCQGWVTSSSDYYGSVWVINSSTAQGGPSQMSCNSSIPIYCCM
jgi:hypothetical protein